MILPHSPGMGTGADSAAFKRNKAGESLVVKHTDVFILGKDSFKYGCEHFFESLLF